MVSAVSAASCVTFPHLDRVHQDRIRCGVSTVSLGNMSYVGEDPEVVRSRRRLFLEELGVQVEPIHPFIVASVLKHGDKIMRVPEEIGHEPPECDILVTDRPGSVLFHTLGDCLGICLFDPEHGAAALAHAGYKGTGMGVPTKVIRYLAENFGTDPSRLVCSLSPCMQGHGVRFQYLGEFFQGEAWAPYLREHVDGWEIRWVDYACDQLVEAGVLPHMIYRPSIDTASSADFFSHHRWANSGKRGIDGRHAMAVALL